MGEHRKRKRSSWTEEQDRYITDHILGNLSRKPKVWEEKFFRPHSQASIHTRISKLRKDLSLDQIRAEAVNTQNLGREKFYVYNPKTETNDTYTLESLVDLLDQTRVFIKDLGNRHEQLAKRLKIIDAMAFAALVISVIAIILL